MTKNDWHSLNETEVAEILKTDLKTGLSENEVLWRQKSLVKMSFQKKDTRQILRFYYLNLETHWFIYYFLQVLLVLLSLISKIKDM
jgi:hypothetical protein